MSEPRIALVTPAFHPQVGGAETYTANVVSRLGAGRPLDVIAAAVAGLPAEHDAPGARVHRVGPGGRGARASMAFASAAAGRLAELRPDVVIAQYSGLLAARRHVRRTGVPLVAIVHDVYGLRESLRWRGPMGALRYLGNDRLMSRARPDAVVVPSEATAVAVRRRMRVPVIVAHPGSDHTPDGAGPDEASRTILFVARRSRSKGARDVVEAVAGLRLDVPDAVLHLVGEGTEPARVPAWVEVSASLDDDELDAAFRSAAVLVLPSRREGWGLVLTEAAARGLAYVAYDIPAVREQHAVVRGGVLVPAGDVASLRGTLRALLRHSAIRMAFGREGRERSRARLRWDDTARAVRSAIGLAMDRAPAHAGSRP